MEIVKHGSNLSQVGRAISDSAPCQFSDNYIYATVHHYK